MWRSLFIASSICALSAGAAVAGSISPGQTLAGVSVIGKASAYEIFGHSGDPGGDYGPDAPAVLTTFAAASNNVFTFSATGLVSCCSDPPDFPPDGGDPGVFKMIIGGANGLSGIRGNALEPLVGVFTTDADPFGSPEPPTLSFNAFSPSSRSPELGQVFYIGDGKTGDNDPGGATLTFTAPATATRLYLGVVDALGFDGTTGYYNDNNGAFSVDVSLQSGGGGPPVPEPAVWTMLLLGCAALGGVLRAARPATKAA
jgi:hypothetical protein